MLCSETFDPFPERTGHRRLYAVIGIPFHHQLTKIRNIAPTTALPKPIQNRLQLGLTLGNWHVFALDKHVKHHPHRPRVTRDIIGITDQYLRRL